MATLVGHEQIWERFRRARERGRLAGSYLFVGPAGVGKRTAAVALAQTLFCDQLSESSFLPCGSCPSCRQVEARSHPDLIHVEKPDDRNSIPLELFIGDREHRNRVGLCHDIWLAPFYGKGKVAIIDDADCLNQEGANCLLKTLEEPPPRSLLILIGTSLQRQLPTIRSRCQVVRFGRLTDAQVTNVLIGGGFVEDPDLARRLAGPADGSVSTAIDLIDDATADMRTQLSTALSTADFDSLALGKEIADFVELVGPEAPPRRARFVRLVRHAARFYQQLMRGLTVPDADLAPDLAAAVRAAIPHWQGCAAQAAACIERCFVAIQQTDASANIATLIAVWIDDLAQLSPPVGKAAAG